MVVVWVSESDFSPVVRVQYCTGHRERVHNRFRPSRRTLALNIHCSENGSLELLTQT